MTTVRETFEQCRTALTEITAIERVLDKLMTMGGPSGYSGTAGKLEKIQGKDEYTTTSRTNNPEAARNQAIDKCEAVLESKRRELAERIEGMEALIARLQDGNARTIMRYYYGVGWTDERIAEEMETIRQVIQRKRNAALNYLEKVVE